MTFNDVYNQFIKSTKNNFPVNTCTEPDENCANVLDSKVPYLCLIIDRRFSNYWEIAILYPYIYKESKNQITFGWVDKDGNVKGNIENSTQLFDEFVVAFREYEEDESYTKLWDKFISNIDEQYED